MPVDRLARCTDIVWSATSQYPVSGTNLQLPTTRGRQVPKQAVEDTLYLEQERRAIPLLMTGDEVLPVDLAPRRASQRVKCIQARDLRARREPVVGSI